MKNRTRADAYARLSQAMIGSNVNPSREYLDALRKYLYEWYEKVTEQIHELEKIRYEVIVGNIGTVYDGSDRDEAEDTFDEYVRQSKSGRGRAGGESVVLMKDDEPVAEHNVEEPE